MKRFLLVAFFLSFTFPLAGCVSSGQPTSNPSSSPSQPGGKDCSYNLENDKRVRVAVFDEKKQLYYDREGIDWVLMKREAGVPAWKVWGGGNAQGGEMVEIGRSEYSPNDPGFTNPDGGSKRVFIGRGHCSGIAGETCVDPLPHTTVFVVTTEGADSGNIPSGRKDESQPGFWWIFNVYYDVTKLPPNPTNDNLPDWVKECRGGGQRGGSVQTNAVLQGETITPPSFVSKASIQKNDNLVHWDEVNDSYQYDEITTVKPESGWAELLGIYTDKEHDFDVWYSTEGLEMLILDPKDDAGNYFSYQPLESIIRPEGKTLQLGTFPVVRKFVYEWWTPTCKPVIYLYPQEATAMSVLLKPFGVITKSEPTYPRGGWQVWAYPSGAINYQGKTYESLFYEGIDFYLKIPSEGFVLAQKELAQFFDWILPQVGLNQKEAKDFGDYWLSRLNKKDKYYLATLIDREEIDRIEPMEITPRPDTLIRVRFHFRELDQPVTVLPPSFSPKYQTRKGLTVVDWGGFFK